jgi:hypothetical protein
MDSKDNNGTLKEKATLQLREPGLANQAGSAVRP